MLKPSEVADRLCEADRVWFRQRSTKQIADAVGERILLLRSLPAWQEISADDVAAAFDLPRGPAKFTPKLTPVPLKAPPPKPELKPEPKAEAPRPSRFLRQPSAAPAPKAGAPPSAH